MPGTDYNITGVKQGQLRADFKIETTELDSDKKFDLENRKKRINFGDGLNKDETENIILEIDDDGDNMITEKELKAFAEKYDVETADLSSIIQTALNDIDESNTTIKDGKEKIITVDAWGKGENSSLNAIIKNNYGIEPNTKEWDEIAEKIMNANPEIYGGKDASGKSYDGRKLLKENDKSTAILYAGDKLTLPGIGEDTDKENGSKELTEADIAANNQASDAFMFEITGITEKDFEQLSSGKSVTDSNGNKMQLTATGHIQVFDENNRLIKEIYKDSNGNLNVNSQTFNGKDTVVEYLTYSGEMPAARKNQYVNSEGKTHMSVEYEYDKNGALEKSLIFEFDDEGNEIRNKIYDPKADLRIEFKDGKYVYYYKNKDGELVSTTNIEDLF